MKKIFKEVRTSRVVSLCLILVATCVLLIGMAKLESYSDNSSIYTGLHCVEINAATSQSTPTINIGTPKITVKNKTEKQVRIIWNKARNAAKYYVYRSTTKRGTYTLVSNTTKRNYVDVQTVGGTKYYYKVRAVGIVNGRLVYGNLSKAKYVKAKVKPLKVVVAGECYVEGIELWASNIYPEGTKFVSKVGVSSNGFLNTKNFKVKGKNATGVEKINSYKPDRVYLLIGMNESRTDNTSPTISNFKKIINKLKAANPNVQVVILPIAPTGRRSTGNVPTKTQRLAFNQAYSNLAASTSGVYYYDYTPLFDNGKGYLKRSYNAGDGYHWTSTATITFSNNLMQWSANNL